MFPTLTSFYAEWRVRVGVAALLHEDQDSPPETLLQAIWQHQRLLRDKLQTPDGEPVRVLHPGFRSVEGGPDFRGAVIQVGDEPPHSGDVEVDLRANGWRAHGHDQNPAFEKVILHVIWENNSMARSQKSGSSSIPLAHRSRLKKETSLDRRPAPPRLALAKVLDAPLGELNLWLGHESAHSLPEALRGRCCAPLRELADAEAQQLLRQAAQVRLQAKAAQFQARARQAGWDQALWEGLFRALGYKHNVWPMQRLAELRPRWAAGGTETVALQARLLGISGLLPADLSRSAQSGTNLYLRRVWDQWWREREEFSDCLLPRTLWRCHGLRPANHPQRRLALASHWAGDEDLGPKLERWCVQTRPERALVGSLLEALSVASDEFWSWHFTFSSARLRKAQPLLGSARATDLAINVVLPWLWIRAIEGRNETVQRAIEQRFFAWPSAEDNSLLRLARQRLLGAANKRLLSTAAAQQGLIQIVRDFCEHSNALCEKCAFPELVREWNESKDIKRWKR